MNDTLTEFERLGNRASVIFSKPLDDWTMAYSCKNRAMELYHANPELQDRMREIAKGFLWSLKQEL